jgi:hypothetical protein
MQGSQRKQIMEQGLVQEYHEEQREASMEIRGGNKWVHL